MFEVLDFLGTIMPIICGVLIVAFLCLLITLIIFRAKKKDVKSVKTATIAFLVCTIIALIGTSVVLDAYGRAAYEQSEDYQRMQESIEKSEEIMERSQESLERLDEINELLEKMG